MAIEEKKTKNAAGAVINMMASLELNPLEQLEALSTAVGTIVQGIDLLYKFEKKEADEVVEQLEKLLAKAGVVTKEPEGAESV